jgi:hypothetical protein
MKNGYYRVNVYKVGCRGRRLYVTILSILHRLGVILIMYI